MTLELRYTLETIDEAVKQFRQATQPYNLFAFSGEMGAGKTTFIHRLCDYLQVEDVVSSPTFALINEYHFRENGQDRTIYHLDWYRLKNAEEALMAGMEDCIEQAARGEAMCLVEWPEKAGELLRKPYCRIYIETLSETERVMRVKTVE
jgi:tRNA threonylcarbamoyladenosine biosynthesis protein TsaE